MICETKMYSVIFILVYCVFSFDAAVPNNIQSPKSSCRKGDIYDVNGREFLNMDDGDEAVEFKSKASVSNYEEYSELRLLDLYITSSSYTLMENPAGWELPIKIEGTHRNFSVQADKMDTEPSRVIKMAVLGLLPSNAFTKTLNFHLQQIKAVEDLIKAGNEKIVLKNDAKDVILVMGNTGSGKTTLVQWLAGDRSKLVAKEVINGLGEFIIEDDQDKISRSTVYSKTTFPELVVDAESNNFYYDLPGFSDTRNSTLDIANSFFIKKVLDHADSVKIVFTVNYPSVKEGVNRIDFMELLEHATKLINDVNKFENSIVLVVTKVDNTYVKKGKSNDLVNDDKVVSGIANFMMQCKHDLEQRTKNDHSTKSVLFYEKSIDLIKILLHNETDKYKRITIFRRPSVAGKLVNSDFLENERRVIRKMLHEEIFFTVKDNKDFGRTLSDKTKGEINQLINAVDISLLNNICSIANKIQVFLLNLVKETYFRIDEYDSIKRHIPLSNLTEIERLVLKLTNSFKIIKELESDIRNINNISNLGIRIENALKSLNMSLALTENISVYGHYMEFFKDILESHTSMSPIAWASTFHDIIVYFSVEEKRIQSNIKTLLNNRDNKIKMKILQIGSELFSLFKEKEVKNNDIIFLSNEFSSFYDMFSKSLQLSYKYTSVQNVYKVIDILNSININLEDDVLDKIFEQNEYKDFFKGVIGRLINNLDESQKWYKFLLHLNRYLSQYHVQQDFTNFNLFTKEIDSLGSNFIVRDSLVEKLLIKYCQDLYQREYENIKDVTLDRIKLYHLQELIKQSLLKPEQFCTDDGKLIVQGHHVKLSEILYMQCPQTVKVIEIFALNTFFVDCNFDRKGESIQFFVVAPIWDVQKNSSILLDGSSGVSYVNRKAPDGNHSGFDGEDGKPGMPGTPGGDFFGIVQNFTSDEDLIISVNGGNGGKGQDGGDGARGSDGTTPRISDPEKYLKNKGWYYNKYKYHWHFLFNYNYDAIYGNNCSNGGDGGRGGRGGHGGYPGTINFVLLAAQKTSFLRGKMGKIGQHGSVGAPGAAGLNGGYAIIDWHLVKSMTVNYFEFQNCISGKVKTHDDVNDRGIEIPQKPDLLKPFHVINDYKKYLRENLKNSAIATFINDFLTKLETDVSIQNLYDASGFLEDMFILETQFYKYLNKTDVLFSYQSLLNRISKHLSIVKYENKNYSQELNALNYLRVAIQSKTYTISYDLENYLVIDVKKYFELLTKRIEKYGKSIKEIKIDKYRDRYESKIKMEIKKANNILIQKVIPEIDKLYVNFDQQIKTLVKDINSRKYEAENLKENLLKKQHELGETMLMRKGLQLLRMFTRITDVFNFVTNLASNALGFDSDIDLQTDLIKAENNFDSLFGLLENGKRCLKENLDEFFDNDLAEKDDGLFHSIKNKIQPLLNVFKSGYKIYKHYLEETELAKNELKQYHNNLAAKKEALDENERLFIASSTKENQENEVSLKVKKLDRVENNIRISEVCCKNGSINGDERSALGGQIENISHQIDVLNYFEKLIYDSLPPLRAKLEQNLYKIGISTVNATHAEIEFNNMKIQNIMQNFKNRMNFMIQIANNEMKSKMKSCVDNLESCMLTVTKINDRINDYYDKTEFANYIADLNSDAETQETDNRALNNDIHRLQVIAQSNVILQEYEKVSMAFKQYMFPFVGLYLDQIVLDYQPTNTTESLVINAIKTIEFLTNELTKDASIIRKKTYRVYPDIRFDSSEIEQLPFYLFASNDYKKEISNLLKGEEIILTANITNGLSKNAIKFREIGIRFIANNESVQSALDLELLQYLIEMTHNGDSYYRCDDKFYVINHNAISMKHSVQRDDSEKHYYHLDYTSNLIRNNPPMCSPYTTWKVKLVNKNNIENFSDLSEYGDDIKEIALEGWGQYVELGLDVCNDNLNKFYNVIGNFDDSVSLDYDGF